VLPSTLTSDDILLYFNQVSGDIKYPSSAGGTSTHTKTSSEEDTHGHEVELPDHTHPQKYGIYDDSHYPQNIYLWINGTDRTSALGGPWASSDAAVQVEVDIAQYLKDSNGDLVRKTHTITFKATDGIDNQGVVLAQIDMLMTIQSIAVS